MVTPPFCFFPPTVDDFSDVSAHCRSCPRRASVAFEARLVLALYEVADALLDPAAVLQMEDLVLLGEPCS